MFLFSVRMKLICSFFQSFTLPVLPHDAWHLILEILSLMFRKKIGILRTSEQKSYSGFFKWSYLNLALFLPPIKKKNKNPKHPNNKELQNCDLRSLQWHGLISFWPVGAWAAREEPGLAPGSAWEADMGGGKEWRASLAAAQGHSFCADNVSSRRLHFFFLNK